MNLSKEAYRALKLFADCKALGADDYLSDENFKRHKEQLVGRGLIEEHKNPIGGTLSFTNWSMAQAGYEYLDAVEQENRENKPGVKAKKVFISTTGEVLKYVLCAVLAAAAWEFVRSYLGFN